MTVPQAGVVTAAVRRTSETLIALLLLLVLAGTTGCSLAGDDDPLAAVDACPKGSVKATQHMKAIGMIDLGTRRVCQPCEAGSYCPGLDSGSTKCATGTYDDDLDPATPCVAMTACAPGTVAQKHGSRTENRTCAQCPAGTYASDGDSTTCSRCEPGTYCPPGSASAAKCWSGTWDHDGNPTTPCVARTACPPGTSDATGGSSVSDSVCTVCPPGTYEDGTRTCVLDPGCPPGTVQVAAGTTTSPVQCEPCAAGESCAGGTAPKLACGNGTWDDDQRASTACVPWTTCGAGQFVDPNGGSATRDRCLPCRPGTYTVGTMSDACLAQTECAPGTYVSDPGSTANDRVCSACPGGSASTGTNAATCGAVSAISADGNRTCAVTSDGTVRCWGDGFGTTPVTISGVTAASAVAVAVHHACALYADGTVGCWGDGSWGRLGDGTTAVRDVAMRVPDLTDVVSLAASEDATYALRADGSVVGWGTYHDVVGTVVTDCGNDGYGPCTTGTYYAAPIISPTPSVLTALQGVTRVVSHAGYVCGLLGGAVRCIDPFRPSGVHDVRLDGVKAFGITDAVLADGTVMLWTAGGSTPWPDESLSGVSAVAEGARHRCYVTRERVACTGSNDSGQLGDGTTHDRASAVTAYGLEGVLSVTAGSVHTCALKIDGSVWCWGGNDFGQIGDGTPFYSLTPSRVADL